MAKRDPKKTYIFDQEYYGPDQPKGYSVADLDKKYPLSDARAKYLEKLSRESNPDPINTGEVTDRGEVLIPNEENEPDLEPEFVTAGEDDPEPGEEEEEEEDEEEPLAAPTRPVRGAKKRAGRKGR